ncbi:hypothetical protein Taro_033827, partial [Colocasia esculenta]|nr:hypothetical protein [Colocasia esculenta]
MVGAVLRLGRMSRGVRRGVSSSPQHPRVLRYSLHHHLWTMAYSCKAWSRRCRLRLRLRLSCRLSLLSQALAPALAPQEHDHGGPSIMERFKRIAPHSFKGESQPLLAESWMREVEKIFRAIRCAEEDKVCNNRRRNQLSRFIEHDDLARRDSDYKATGRPVKESRRVPVPLLVPVSITVESGLHHQQSNAFTCEALG